MIWNLDINDPNLRYMIYKQKEQLQKYNEQQVLFQEGISKIENEKIKQILQNSFDIFLDRKLSQNVTKKIEICAQIQQQFNKFQEILTLNDLTQLNQYLENLTHILNFHHEIINSDEYIVKYINKYLKEIEKQISEKYEQQIINEFQQFGFPYQKEQNNNIKNMNENQLKIYSELINNLITIDKKFLCSLFVQLNQHFDYHFIEILQQTSEINNSQWLFNYLFETFDNSIKYLFSIDLNYENPNENQEYQNIELEQTILIISNLMISQFILPSIQKRIKRDCDDFLNSPNLGLTFLEEAYNFTNDINQLSNHYFKIENFEQKYKKQINIFLEIMIIFEENNLLLSILEWEAQLFKINIFDVYEKQLNKNDFHQFLNLVEEFEIVWDSQYTKYKNINRQSIIEIVSQQYQTILINFLQVCKHYWSLIKKIEEKDYVQFLQTYWVGLKRIKDKFPQFKREITQLKKFTLIKQIEPLTQQCSEQIFKKLYLEILLNDKQFLQFLTEIKEITIYKNHSIYFVQSIHEYTKQINNFYYKSNILINQIITELIILKQYTVELTYEIIKKVLKRIQDLINGIILKTEFSVDGYIIFELVIKSTTYYNILSSLNMENTKLYQQEKENFDSFYILTKTEKWPFDNSTFKKYPKLNQQQIDLIKNVKVILLNQKTFN